MKGKIAGIVGTVMILWSVAAFAADPSEITVSEIKLPDLNWGLRTASFEVTNNTDWVKFLTVETEVTFTGHYLNPRRYSRTNYPLEPQFTKTLNPVIDIPANFGEAKLYIRIYDMVDTLDALSSGTMLFEQPFTLQFHLPSGISTYLENKISVPPLAGNSHMWDNEFSRVLALLLRRQLTVPQIAKMAECDSALVARMVQQMTDLGYIIKSDSGYLFNFPIISADEAEEGRLLADKIAKRLDETVTANLKAYPMVLDSLRTAGSIAKDSNDFMGGTAVAYYQYPAVGGLVLWYTLGQRFITQGVPMAIYAGSDPCNAATRFYMYLTEGGDLVNGHQYFSVDPSGYKLGFFFGDTYPKFNCDNAVDAPGQPLKQGAGWSYDKEMIPEIFVIDTAAIAPAYRALLRNTDPIMTDALNDLKTIVDKYGHTKNTLGIRYWFWNMCASKTLDRMVKEGTLARRGNGQYKFSSNK